MSSAQSSGEHLSTLAGWLSSVLGPKNPFFQQVLTDFLETVSLNPKDSIFNSSGDVVNDIIQKLVSKELYTDDVKQKFVSKIVETIIESANQLVSIEKKKKNEESKFGIREANFGDVSAFFGGLKELIGEPHPDLFEAVRKEHCEQDDSNAEFVANSYHISTAPKKEWQFVFDSDNSETLVLTRGVSVKTQGGENVTIDLGFRERISTSELKKSALTRLREISGLNLVSEEEFAAINLTEIEIGCLRLYTGPMFQKYNQLLRQRGNEVQKQQTGSEESKIKRYPYCTTIHLISSGLVKLSKIQPALPLYRGLHGIAFPPRLWHSDKFNVKGGVEFAFTSCSTNKDVALGFSHQGYLFELATGMVTRGATISWLSFYPEEQEVCLPPCTALEVTNNSRFQDHAIVVEMNVISNPATATIDELLGLRKKVLVDLGEILKNQLSDSNAVSEEKKIREVVMNEYLQEMKHTNFMVYNEDAQFHNLMKSMIDLQYSLKDANDLDSALYHAVKSRSLETIQILCRNSANIMRPINGVPIVKTCIELGHLNELEALCRYYLSQSIDLTGMCGDDQNAAVAILNGLKQNSSLQTISVAENGVTDEMLDSFIQEVSQKNIINDLNLRGNQITLKNSTKLQKWISSPECSLVSLNLSKNPLSLKSAIDVSNLYYNNSNQKLKNPFTDQLSVQKWISSSDNSGILSVRARLSHLDVGFICNEISSSQMSELKIFTDQIEKEHILLINKSIKENSSKKLSGIQDKKFANEVFGFVESIQEFLNFSSIQVGNGKISLESSGSSPLAVTLDFQYETENNNLGQSNIPSLIVKVNKSSTKELNLLFDQVSKLSSIREFGIIGNFSKGLKVKHENISNLESLINKMDTLTSLSLQDYQLEESGFSSLAKSIANLKNLTSLNVSGNNLTLPVAEILSSSPAFLQLQSLNLEATNLTVETSQFLSTHLKQMTLLKSLNISNNNLKSDSLAHISQSIASLTAISYLNVKNNKFEVEGMKILSPAIKALSELTVLDVSGNYILVEGAQVLSESLQGKTALQELYISKNDIHADGAKHLSSVLNNFKLTILDVSENNLQTDGTKHLVSALTNSSASLQQLNISLNKLQAEGVKSLSQGIQNFTSLRSLNLSENKIDAQGVAHLSQPLKALTQLTTLDISTNALQAAGAKSLSEGIKDITTLTYLNVSTNRLQSEGGKNLFEGIKNLTNLQSLFVANNRFDSVGAKYFGDVITNLPHLKILDFSDNGIQSEGMKHFNDISKNFVSLESLNLAGNQLQEQGAKNLSTFLKNVPLISSLDINSNLFKAEDAKVLFDGISHLFLLKHLDISKNLLRAEGTESLTNSINLAFTIRSLNLSDNAIENKGLNIVYDKIQNFTSLLTLDVSSNQVHDEELKNKLALLAETQNFRLVC